MVKDKLMPGTGASNKKAYLFSLALFIFLFVFFVYGALFLGLLELAHWLIGAKELHFFAQKGFYGVLLFTFGLISLWFFCAYTVSKLFYAIFAFFSNKRLARQASVIVFFAFFHIFTIPWILWPSFRANVPSLQKRYRDKLRQKVRAKRLRGDKSKL